MLAAKKKIGHGKRKKLAAKKKLPRQKKNARNKKKIGYGERKKLPAKESNSQKKTKKIRHKVTRKTSLETKF